MKETDAVAVCILAGQLGYEMDIAQFFGRFSMMNEDPNHTLWVLDSSETGVAGWMHLEKAIGLVHLPRLEIKAVVVDQTQRGSGLGKRFIRYAESFARTEGFYQVFLTSNITRKDTHLFYEKLGYAQPKTSLQFVKNLEE